jgi:hypothetical protein
MPFVYLVVIGVVLAIVSLSGPLDSGSGKKRILKGSIFLFANFTLVWLVGQGKAVGVLESRIVGKGSNYEIVATTLVPNAGTLVYAVDLDGNKEKVDILAQYPIDGYKIEKVGERTFLLPNSTRVTQGKKGDIVLVSEGGEAISVPMSEGPVNPPLGGPGN